MPLRRIGNKKKYAKKIASYIERNSDKNQYAYLETCFGTGAPYFALKNPFRYNFLNDLDNDVYNFWQVFMFRFDELYHQFEYMPVHRSLFNHWQKNKETEPVKKALRFLFLSNFSLFAKMDCMILDSSNEKQLFFKTCHSFYSQLVSTDSSFEVKFDNQDYRKFINSIKERIFEKGNGVTIFHDAPYYDTTQDTYNTTKPYKKNDVIDSFELLSHKVNTYGNNIFISEFSNPFILELADFHNLQVVEVATGKNLNSPKLKTEIICTNSQLDFHEVSRQQNLFSYRV